jgi:hypothetical protein
LAHHPHQADGVETELGRFLSHLRPISAQFGGTPSSGLLADRTNSRINNSLGQEKKEHLIADR